MTGTDSVKWLQRSWELPQLRLRAEGPIKALRGLSRGCWQKLCAARDAVYARSERRCLRVAESISLGDKRSVYLIEVDGQRLLLGASAAGVTLLSELQPVKSTRRRTVKAKAFEDVMQSCASAEPTKQKPRTRSSSKEPASKKLASKEPA